MIVVNYCITKRFFLLQWNNFWCWSIGTDIRKLWMCCYSFLMKNIFVNPHVSVKTHALESMTF